MTEIDPEKAPYGIFPAHGVRYAELHKYLRLLPIVYPPSAIVAA